MVLYETLKFIHIVGATVVLGGGILITAFLFGAVRSRKPERVQALSAIASWVGPRVFAPAWALVLAFGIWAALENNLSFGDAWITIGFVVFAVGFVLGPGVHERNAKALGAAMEGHGAGSEQALAVCRRELAVSVFEVAILVFAVWAMTAKPGL